MGPESNGHDDGEHTACRQEIARLESGLAKAKAESEKWATRTAAMVDAEIRHGAECHVGDGDNTPLGAFVTAYRLEPAPAHANSCVRWSDDPVDEKKPCDCGAEKENTK